MQQITLDQIQPGMYLSRPLISGDGKVLLHEGMEVTERYIQYLRNKGITSLFIGEPAVEGADVPAVTSQQAEQETVAAADAAQDVISHFRVGKGIQLDGVKSIVSDMIDQLSQQPEKMVHLLDLRRKEEYMFSHSVNTAILSVMTGIALGYTAEKLEELGLAAMLHDVGKIKFPRQVAQQYPGYLSKEDREEYRRHPFYSLEILRQNAALSVDIVNACFQHHERWNGSGYPMGLSGTSISEYAQIISIADVYDRLIAGMPNRLPTPVYYAVAILNKAAGEYFNPALVDAFTQNVAIYPMGKAVVLNNQQKGVILGVGIKNRTTPIVRMIVDQDGNPIDQPIELDLMKNPELFIVDFEDQYFSHAQAYADRAYVSHVKKAPM
jgi:HD-GYP domain-containing protein (c-di-GMP phosphodiesterase class II)